MLYFSASHSSFIQQGLHYHQNLIDFNLCNKFLIIYSINKPRPIFSLFIFTRRIDSNLLRICILTEISNLFGMFLKLQKYVHKIRSDNVVLLSIFYCLLGNSHKHFRFLVRQYITEQGMQERHAL